VRPRIDFGFIGYTGEPFTIVVDGPLPNGSSFGTVMIEKIRQRC
jgi:hypothetical protein